MIRRGSLRLGVFAVLREELAKVGPMLRYDAANFAAVVKGTDGMTPEDVSKADAERAAFEKIRDRVRREKQQEVDAEAAPQAHQPTAPGRAAAAHSEDRAAASAATSPGQGAEASTRRTEHREKTAPEDSTPEAARRTAPRRRSASQVWAELKDAMRDTFGTRAGVAAIINHCTNAHAASVAVEQGIDVKSVSVSTQRSAVGEGSRVVGYIDAPAASEEEVTVYAQKLERACPAARAHGGVEWRKR